MTSFLMENFKGRAVLTSENLKNDEKMAYFCSIHFQILIAYRYHGGFHHYQT